MRKTRSAPSIRRCRWAGWWSSSASAVITASSGSVPEWLATTSAPPVDGTCSQAGRLHPEPLLVQRAERRGQHVLGEVAVEAELVDLVVAGDPAAQEGQAAGDPALPRPTGPGPAPGRSPGRAAVGPAGRRLVAVQRDHPRVTHGASRPSSPRPPPGPRRACRPRPAAPRSAGPASPAAPVPDEVVERRHRVVPRRVAELVAQPGRVDHPAELEEAAAAPGRSRAARPGVPPGRRRCTTGAGTGTGTRPARRTSWDSSSTPAPPTLTVPGRPDSVARRSTSSASSACSSCTRGSKPSTVGTTGSRR